MKDVLTPNQIADLAAISEICAKLQADLVVIGAMSLLVCLTDIRRFTRDVDLTVALDLDEFGVLTDRLSAAGWAGTAHGASMDRVSPDHRRPSAGRPQTP